MHENRIYKGYWFLPDNPDIKVYGIYEFDPLTGSRLELMGAFKRERGQFQTYEIDIVIGRSTDGKDITLYRCLEVNYVLSFTGTPTSTIRADYAFVGAKFNSSDEMVFNKATVMINNLDEWLNISGFEIGVNLEEKITNISYKLPSQINFSLDDEYDGMFNFVATNPSIGSYTRRATIEQNVELLINSKNGNVTLDSIMRTIYHFQIFLTLGAYDNCYLLSLILYSTEQKQKILGKVSQSKIELLYPIKRSEKRNSLFYLNMLYNYRDIHENYKNIIAEWFKQKEILNPILYLFINNFDNKTFNENSFLNIVQAIETFHRRFKKNKILTAAEHDKMIKDILSSTIADHREWLKSKLIFSNEPTLQQRLEDLLAEYENSILSKIISDKKEFIKKVKNSRNYYTHYDKSLIKKKVEGYELYILAEKLKALLICCLLSVISFKKEQIEFLLERNEYRFFNNIIDRKLT